jgi:hypothetical protein
MEEPMELSGSNLKNEEKHWGVHCLSEMLKKEDTKFSTDRYDTIIIVKFLASS